MTDHKELKIDGIVGDWLQLHLLRAAESPSQDLLDLWVFSVTGSGKLERVNKLNNSLKELCDSKFPHMGLHLALTKKSQRYQSGGDIVRASSHRIAWAESAKLSGQVFEAAEHTDDAQAFFQAGKIEDAAESVVRAVSLCPLGFPPYAICLRVFSTDCPPGRTDQSRVPEIKQPFLDQDVVVLLNGIAFIDVWLARLERGFDFDRIPAKYHTAIRNHCLKELRARRQILAKLRELLDGGGDMASAIENPLNPLLDAYLCAIATHKGSAMPEDILDETSMRALVELQVATETYIRRSSDGARDVVDQMVSQNSLLDALLDLVEFKPNFRFPEPCETTKWRERSVRIWGDAVLYPPSEEPLGRGQIPPDQIGFALSGERMINGVAERPHRTTSHHGDQEFD